MANYSSLSYLLSNLTANTTDYAEKLYKIKRKISYINHLKPSGFFTYRQA